VDDSNCNGKGLVSVVDTESGGIDYPVCMGTIDFDRVKTNDRVTHLSCVQPSMPNAGDRLRRTTMSDTNIPSSDVELAHQHRTSSWLTSIAGHWTKGFGT
jgi:hypothetical protein